MKHQGYISYLRVISSFAVVIIHVTAKYNNLQILESSRFTWESAYVLGSLSRFAVPVFIMITGCLLLGRNESWFLFYRKRYSRLIPPFCFWNILYLTLGAMFADNIELGDRLIHFGCKLYASSHMWYVSMLLLVMMFVPLINSMICGVKLKNTEIKVVALLCLFAYAILGVNVFLSSDNSLLWLDGLRYTGYLYLGYVLCHYSDALKKYFKLIVISSIFSALFCLWLGIHRATDGHLIDLFNYNSLPVLLQAVCVFLGMNLQNNKLKENRIINSLSDCSFGIYLVHPIVIRLWERTANKYMESILSDCFLDMALFVIIAGFVYLISYLLIAGFRRTKFGQRVC